MTPQARLDLIAELAAGLPHGRYVGVQVNLHQSEEGIALVLALGGSMTTYAFSSGEAHEEARLRRGVLEIAAHRIRPAAPAELAVLQAQPPEPVTCAIVEAAHVA